MAMLDDEELQAIYTWVDEIPLSRPKRNISRDFSDGVLAAEIIYHYFSQLVELHNYSAANAVSGKMYNWRTMNQKVFKKLGFSVPKEELEDIVNARPGAVERLLKTLRKHVRPAAHPPTGTRHSAAHSPDDTSLYAMASRSRTRWHATVPAAAGGAAVRPRPPRSARRRLRAPTHESALNNPADSRPRAAGPGSDAGDASFASGASARTGEGGSPMAGGSGRRRAPGTNGQSAGADVGAGDQPETDNVGGYGAYVDRDALKREVDAELLTEKEQEIQDLRETVELLDRKVQKLEQLVRLKDSKIQALQSRLAGGDGQ